MSRPALLLVAAALTNACVLAGGKPYFVWAVPPMPPAGPTTSGEACERLQPGSGSLVRVRVSNLDREPLPGVTVEVTRAGTPLRRSVTDSDGNADVWLPPGTWTVRARLLNFQDGAGEVVVLEDRFCEITFRLWLERTIED